MGAMNRCAGVLLLALLSGCGRLPNTAVPEDQAEQHFGAFNASTPIVTLVKRNGIRTPDPRSGVPLLDQTVRELRKSDPHRRFAGITYSLTRGNALEPDWLVQTPNAWGRRASDLPFYPLKCEDCDPDLRLPSCRTDGDCKGGGTCRALSILAAALPGQRVCVGHSDALVDRIYALLIRARRTVDIAVLQPRPDARFLAALRKAVSELARSGRHVRVRMVIGHYPLVGVEAGVVLADLARDGTGPTISLEAAAVRTCAGETGCDSFSWNHAKIIAIDGEIALVGGHNLWTTDYLIDKPVHDLSMQVRGPAAADAVRFIETLWRYACDHVGSAPGISVVHRAAGAAKAQDGCPPAPPRQRTTPRAVAAGSVSILAIGRLGSGITRDFANQNDLARDLLLGAARQSIRIVQQDIAFTLGRLDPLYPESTLQRLADFLLTDRGDLHIVLSDPKAIGNSGSSYGNGVSLESVARKLRQVARERSALPDPALDALLCRRLFMAPLRFGPDATWPAGKTIGSHVKFWMIDDRVFYIGSDNFYPVDLQEFGYIVDNREAAADVLRDWWTPLWTWSRAAAISGADAPRCIFGPPAALAASKINNLY
jgi:hypothetical protein